MARIRNGTIQVEGLRDLERELKTMDKALRTELRLVNKSVAAYVATDAAAAARTLGSTPAHVAPSIKPTAGTGFAGVAGGGPRYPMFAGAEFGAKQYHQFKTWRGNGDDAGYFLFPTIRRDEPEIVRKYEAGLDGFLHKAGLK